MGESFSNEWFEHPEWWFHSSNEKYDETISKKWGHLLDIDEFSVSSSKDCVNAVLVWDQLPRHFYRKEYSVHIVCYFLQKALEVVFLRWKDVVDCLSAQELCFFLLPLRHSLHFSHIELALEICWKRLKECREKSDMCVLKRFLTATYRRMPLDGFEIEMCMPLVVPRRKECLDSIGDFEDVAKERSSPIVLSLSGGVDSMVCSLQLCSVLQTERWVAVMINYDNRSSCDEEVNFVKRWCEEIGVRLFVRHIHEIHRPTCMEHGMREIYETYTRNVRYETYRRVWKDVFGNTEGLTPVVVLGHNKDDAFENIMTNISSNHHYENLLGMNSSQVVDGIRFVRPLLNVSKDNILCFAKKHNIVHLPCSTPEWSQRGKIRRDIVPALTSWHPQCIVGIFDVAQHLKGLHEMMDCCVDEWVGRMSSVNEGEWCGTFDTESLVTTKPNFFWQLFFQKVGGSENGRTISKRSLQQFVENLQQFVRSKIHERHQFVLNKHIRVYLTRKTDKILMTILKI